MATMLTEDVPKLFMDLIMLQVAKDLESFVAAVMRQNIIVSLNIMTILLPWLLECWDYRDNHEF